MFLVFLMPRLRSVSVPQTPTNRIPSQQRGRSALKDRCVVVLGEFSEVYGPLALKIVPDDIEKSTREEISNFIGELHLFLSLTCLGELRSFG